MSKCQGGCEYDGGHRGEVRRVHVHAPQGIDWGEFDYCERAVEIDKERKMDVYAVDDDGSLQRKKL